MGLFGKSPSRRSPSAAPKPSNKPGLTAGKIGQSLDITLTDHGLLQAFRSQVNDRSVSTPAQLNGVQRAARLMLALGAEQAAGILKELSPEEIERVMTEMATLDHISAEEKRQILAEFDETARDFEAPVRGGVDQARRILEIGLGQDKAEEILSRVTRRDLYSDFEFLERIEAGVLAGALAQEHLQVAAVAVSFLKPRIAAAVLRQMPEEYRSEIALRLARAARIHPEAVQRVARALREKFEKRQSEIYSEIGGAETLANILNHMDRSQEDEILDVLDKKAPDLYEQVKDRLYTFEEILNLDNREMRLLVARVNDDLLLASALRGAGDEIRRQFFNAMSQNRAADIVEEIDRRGPLSIKEINEARQYVLNVARRLDEDGEIVIKKEKHDYI
ncbi:MAG: flagellar motor switch protein FliG [Leptospirales bacterium]|nr:flagellar motor switch protein FliG [Leptospirales bacterium]